MRRFVYLILVGVLLAVAADGFLQLAGERPLPRPDTPRDPAVPPYNVYLPVLTKRYVAGYVSPFGIDMYSDNTDAQGQTKLLQAGAGWETIVFSWAAIEPTAPISGVHTYDWLGFDATVARAQVANMHLLVLFTNNPTWAASLPGGPVTSTHVSDLENIAAVAAERYDGDGFNDASGSPAIYDWSFYAEPDNGDLGYAQTLGRGYWGNNPSGYADMIAGVHTAMAAANPHVVVMIGGLAYDYFTTQGGPFVQSFLDGVLKRLNSAHGGAANTLGALAFHYYPISADWPTIKDKAAVLRSILTDNGVGSMPLIVPEMGYWSQIVAPNSPLNSNEGQQANRLVQMFVQGVSAGIKEMSWFEVFDSGSGTEAHGLFRGTDLSQPKPAYTAYSVMTNELFGAKYQSAISGGGVEGYVFLMPGGDHKTVLWATASSAQYTFHQSCVRRVDVLGSVASPILDGNAAWDVDHVSGQITLLLGQDHPIYVGSC